VLLCDLTVTTPLRWKPVLRRKQKEKKAISKIKVLYKKAFSLTNENEIIKCYQNDVVNVF